MLRHWNTIERLKDQARELLRKYWWLPGSMAAVIPALTLPLSVWTSHVTYLCDCQSFEPSGWLDPNLSYAIQYSLETAKDVSLFFAFLATFQLLSMREFLSAFLSAIMFALGLCLYFCLLFFVYRSLAPAWLTGCACPA